MIINVCKLRVVEKENTESNGKKVVENEKVVYIIKFFVLFFLEKKAMVSMIPYHQNQGLVNYPMKSMREQYVKKTQK